MAKNKKKMNAEYNYDKLFMMQHKMMIRHSEFGFKYDYDNKIGMFILNKLTTKHDLRDFTIAFPNLTSAIDFTEGFVTGINKHEFEDKEPPKSTTVH